MSSSFQQKATGAMTYPARQTLDRLLFKSPLIWWRMGLGPLLGRTMLVLTTWGRKSGLPRYTVLSYTVVNGKVYVGSGWGSRADWYRNIQANPRITVQIGKRTYSAFARRVEDVDEFRAVMQRLLETGGDSHFRSWLRSLDIAYDLNDLVAKRDRVHQVALDPTDEPGPPPLEADLTWVWGVMLVSFAVGWMMGRASD
ncbi:MAG: nitroreductase family deazaflavin-dependent oxidoreductase [Anaerolineae bacterium]|nr:nitroreductase family deazaflavin-dependent oxidoreductase [Anaerolineae bacterium]